MQPPWTNRLLFIVPGVAAVLIAAAFTGRRATRLPPVQPHRFSGSAVVIRMPSLLASPQLPEPVTVDIVRDEAAASFYDSPKVLDSIVAVWRTMLASTGARVRVVSPAIARRSTASVLVVPSSPCLTIATREAIETAGARKQGLILTGRVGTHDAGCRSLGYGTLIGITGASRADVLGDRPMVYVTVPADGPLSADIPPGSRLNVSPAGQIALRVSARDAFYSEYTLQSAPARGEPYLDAAIVRASYHGARVAWFGFELRDVVSSRWEAAVLRLLLRNAVAWTGDVPMASVASWPGRHSSAAVIAQDVEDRFGTARFAVDSLEAAGVRSSFYVLSDAAGKNRRLVRRMLASGEVGTHSARHELYGGMPFERQIERLRASREVLGRLIDGDVAGLRPPEEQFDAATLAAWAGVSGRYVLGANDARCAAPELLSVNARHDTLLLLPRVFADDFAAMRAGTELKPPSVVREQLLGDVETAKRLNGLYVLSYHSQLLSRPEYVPVLASVARELAADSTTWVATAGDVAEWWLARAKLVTRVTQPSANILDVTVRNPGPRAAKDVTVLLSLPNGRSVRTASVPVDARDGQLRLRIGSVQPGGSTRVRVYL